MLSGRLDEIRNGVLYGWAADSDNPDDHLLVQAFVHGRVVASGRAGLERADLVGNGVGNGDHAFEIALPPGFDDAGSLQVVAYSDGLEIPLANASSDERHIERLFDMHGRHLEQTIRLLHNDQVELRNRIDAASGAGIAEAMAEATADLDRRIRSIEERLDEVDVFLMRIDTRIKSLDDALGGDARRPGLLRRLFGLGSRKR